MRFPVLKLRERGGKRYMSIEQARICCVEVFHANNGSFLIKAGTSNSHTADPVLLRLVQFYNDNFILHAAFQVIYGID